MGAVSQTSKKRSRSRGLLSLGVSVVVCLLAGAVGGLATSTSVDTWYPGIAKPSWNPPAAVFGPVWTTLFVMMALSVWLVWRRRAAVDIRPALLLFGAQLFLNICWSVIFFGFRQPGAAFAELVVLWIAIAATVRSFWKISPPAAGLLLPYLGWVSFAALLNFAIWRLNA